VRGWSLLDELVLEVHALSARFPEEERAGLGRTLRSAAVASAAILMRGTLAGEPELRRAAGLSLRSLASLRYQLYLARRLNLMDTRRYRAVCMRHDRTVAALTELCESEGPGERLAKGRNASLSAGLASPDILPGGEPDAIFARPAD
jgi:four helix bundle protein